MKFVSLQQNVVAAASCANSIRFDFERLARLRSTSLCSIPSKCTLEDLSKVHRKSKGNTGYTRKPQINLFNSELLKCFKVLHTFAVSPAISG